MTMVFRSRRGDVKWLKSMLLLCNRNSIDPCALPVFDEKDLLSSSRERSFGLITVSVRLLIIGVKTAVKRGGVSSRFDDVSRRNRFDSARATELALKIDMGDGSDNV
jgi:hypothetical protein